MEPGFPRISHISAYAAHQGGLVLWYGLGRPVTTSKEVILVRFCIVWMTFRIRDIDGNGKGVEPFPSRCHRDSGINKAARVLLLGYAKMSNTKDMLKRQTCQGIPCPHLVT